MKSQGKHSEEAIRIEAYLLSERAGHPPGMDATFWTQAEAIVRGRVAALAGDAVAPAVPARKKAPAAPKPASKAPAAKPAVAKAPAAKKAAAPKAPAAKPAAGTPKAAAKPKPKGHGEQGSLSM